MLLRTLVVALVGALLTLVPAEAQAAKAKKKKQHAITGVIESVSPEKDKGTLVLKVHAKKKKKAAAAGETAKATETKLQFGVNTKVEFKKKKEVTAGSLSDLKAGERVRVTAKGDVAERIVIKKSKKKKNA